MRESIDGASFAQAMIHAAASLNLQKQQINELNVFPVPDGDTGTNMSLTIQTAVTELSRTQPESIAEAAKTTASALLRGARGNSGVILSLLFRGVSKSFKGLRDADGLQLAAALQEGVTTAYGAVMKPAEGTVLTVSRLAAKRAVDTAAEGADVEATLAAAIEEGYDALAQTTDMNPVLKKAGVVDAGGKGYLLILEGMLAELRGEPIPESAEEPAEHKEKADFNAMAQEEITFTFDTVYVVRKAREDIDLMPLRAYLSSIGDSLVIGEDDETFKVHVHTDIPGVALTESQKYGTLELAKIENMRSQADALAAGKAAQSTDDLEAIEEELENGESGHKVAAPEKAVGFLAICAGDGLAAVFRDLGCDAVVSGGQTMNPSTESILAGIDQVPAETVFVLPNNGNIIMAAQQCQGLTEKNVVVIPSKTVPQGITAMMNVDPEAQVESITAAMTDALSTVTTSQITYAARDSDFDGFEIHQGDYLALKEGKLFGTDTQLDALLEKLAEEGKDASFIALYYGEDVTEEAAQAAGARFQAVCPNAEISVLPGGQPVYYYIISFE
ncbi:MAG: DAK2 domain-containing protein [Clostridiales bacterium]|nr:DAK2 domain-containing protein [Clostridiales bacterium]